MTSRKTEAGTTLIELLIGISLMSLLSVAVLYSMRLGLSSQERANAKMMSNRRVSGAERILEQQIANLIPIVGECRPDPVSQPQQIAFFQGDPQAMRFASSYSLEEAQRGYPQILEYAVIPGEENRGVRLIVNELLYTGVRSTQGLCTGMGIDPLLNLPRPRFRPIMAMPTSFVLADKLASCRFLYREIVKDPQPGANPEKWLPVWLKTEFPSAIRIEMTPLESGPGSLHVMTVTAPIRLTVDPLRKNQF